MLRRSKRQRSLDYKNKVVTKKTAVQEISEREEEKQEKAEKRERERRAVLVTQGQLEETVNRIDRKVKEIEYKLGFAERFATTSIEPAVDVARDCIKLLEKNKEEKHEWEEKISAQLAEVETKTEAVSEKSSIKDHAVEILIKRVGRLENRVEHLGRNIYRHAQQINELTDADTYLHRRIVAVERSVKNIKENEQGNDLE